MRLYLIFNTDLDIHSPGAMGDALYVFLHWLPHRKALDAGIRTALLDDLIDCDIKARIDRDAINFTRNWYYSAGKDFTIFNGISVGALSEYRLLGRIIEILRMHYAFQKLTDENRFDEIQTDLHPSSYYFDLTNSHFHKSGAKVSVMPPFALDPFVAPTASLNCYDTKKGTVLRHWLKNKIESFRYRERKLSDNEIDSVPRVVFSAYRNESVVLKYLFENHRDEILPVLDKKAMPSPDISGALLRRGARVLDIAGGAPEPECEDFACQVAGCIESESYRDMLEASFQNKGLAAVFEELLLGLVRREFPSIAANILHYKNRFREMKPAGVVVYNDAVEHQRLLVMIAKEMGIPSLLIQHGHHAEPNDGDKRYADYLAVWGAAVREQYVKRGRNGESVIVTGNPYHDPLSNMRSNDNDGERGNWILIITHPENRLSAFGDKGLSEKYIEEVLKAARTVGSEVRWIIKLHPSESESYYARALKMMKASDFKMLKRADLVRMLRSCAAVILPDSTVFTEAYLCGTPIISLNVTGKNFEPPLEGRDSVSVVKDFGELAEIIMRTLSKGNLKEVCHLENILDSTGHSTRRVAELILEIIESKTKTPMHSRPEESLIEV